MDNITIPINNYYKPYQYKTVTSGSSEVIWELTVYDKNMILFITSIGNTWFPNTILRWEIDGEVIEDIQRIIGSVDNPFNYNPPFVVRSYMRVTAINNSSSDHVFEFIANGYFIPKEELMK